MKKYGITYGAIMMLLSMHMMSIGAFVGSEELQNAAEDAYVTRATVALFDGGADPIWVRALSQYLKFRKAYRKDPKFMNLLSQGQEPKIMVIACSDSRVDPALILQTRLGDLFMVRNVANIVPAFVHDSCYHSTAAALEYGVTVLKVQHLIILGHSQCGGIRGALEGTVGHNDFIAKWVSQIKPRRGITGQCDGDDTEMRAFSKALDNTIESRLVGGLTDDEVNRYAKRALSISYNNCLTYPWIKERVDRGQLVIHRWFFNIATATLYLYSHDKQQFEPLNETALNNFLISQGQGVY